MIKNRSKASEWLVTAPSFLWLALFFAVPAVVVLAFTFHGNTPNGGVGEWSLQTWRDLVNPDYPAIVWNTIRISFEVTFWCILLALPCAYAIARMNSRWRTIVAGSIMLPIPRGRKNFKSARIILFLSIAISLYKNKFNVKVIIEAAIIGKIQNSTIYSNIILNLNPFVNTYLKIL